MFRERRKVIIIFFNIQQYIYQEKWHDELHQRESMWEVYE